jgi:SAM-dependent methyltransferase
MSEYRDQARTRWAASASGWEAGATAFNREALPVSSWMVDALAPQPGYEILELATGTGDTGLLAAELVQPGGTVTLSDFVPEMLSAAQRMAEARGATNVRFRQIDAEVPLDLEAASLDGVLSRWGYHLLVNQESALGETRRILRPGTRVALSAWTDPADNPWSSLVARTLVAQGLAEPPDGDAPGQFAWAREGIIAERLEGAGFVEHAIDTIDFAVRHASVDAWWEQTASRSDAAAAAARRLDAAGREAVLAGLTEASEAYRQPDGSLVLPARTWVAWAEA